MMSDHYKDLTTVLTVVIVFGHCFCVESSVRNSVITSEDLVEGRS